MIGNSATKAIKGAGALAEILDSIGAVQPPNTDAAVAKLVVENELELRALLSWSLEHFNDH